MEKYTYYDRLKIGKEIYEHNLNCYEAGIKYSISYWTARTYLRLYKAELKVNNVSSITFYETDWDKVKEGHLKGKIIFKEVNK